MPEPSTNPIFSFLPLILMFVVFYFLLIRPQQKKQAVHAQLLKKYNKGIILEIRSMEDGIQSRERLVRILNER
jgi:preprotein translocase YajC subunit